MLKLNNVKKTLAIKHLIALFSLLTLLTSSNAQTISYVIQGNKVDAKGNQLTTPSATVSIREIKDSSETLSPLFKYQSSFGSNQNSFFQKVKPGKYEIGVQVPDGYDVLYSVCKNCTQHSINSYQPYNRGSFAKPLILDINSSNAFIDLSIMFKRSSSLSNPIQASTSQELICNFNGSTRPPVTDEQIYQTDTIWSKIGISNTFGGIPVVFQIGSRSDPTQAIDILEARSAGGAAWQTSLNAADDDNNIWLFNQSAGNMTQQWGYSGNFSAGKTGISQKNWSPLWSDHFHPNLDYSKLETTSPCYGSSLRLAANGQENLIKSEIKSPKGNILRLENAYSVNFLQNKSWKWWVVDQAMYLNKAAARKANLKVYLVGLNKEQSIGPISPYNPFHVSSSPLIRSVKCDIDGGCALSSKDISYAVFTWRISGQEIAMVIHQKGKLFNAILNLSPNLRCKSNDDCGNINWHLQPTNSRYNIGDEKSFNEGEIKTYSVIYDIGTVDQIKSLGYVFPP